MFGRRKRLRLAAIHMLLVWLFALGTGIVNACIVAPEARHAEMTALAALDEGMEMHGHDHAAMAQDDPLPDAGMAPCAKFCAEEATSVPVAKLLSDPLHALWLAPPSTVTLVVAATPQVLRIASAPAALASARIPIPIAFLRLTL